MSRPQFRVTDPIQEEKSPAISGRAARQPHRLSESATRRLINKPKVRNEMGCGGGLSGTDATGTDAVGAEPNAEQKQTQKWPASEGLRPEVWDL